MSKATIAAASVLFILGCASIEPFIIPTKLAVDPHASVVILTRDTSMGHGCPVDGYIYTAWHLVKDESVVTWSDSIGNAGRARVVANDAARDLSVLEVLEGNPVYIKFANSAAPGQEVFWTNYDFSESSKVFARSIEQGKIIDPAIAGYISFKGNLTPGSSGGCLLNSEREALGIVVWAINLRPGELLNMAVSLVQQSERRIY